jgi:transcriptional regulator with XRE-family HTH domain
MQAQEDIEKPVDQRRALRQLLNLSQHAVAKAIGVPQSRLSEWERGRLEITPEQQEKWNQVLEERVKEDPWLMFGVERLVVRHTFELSNYWKKAIEDVINQTLDAQNKLLDELPTLSDELQRQRSADVLALTAPIYQLGEKYVAKIKDANIEVKSKVKEKAEEKIGGKENAS